MTTPAKRFNSSRSWSPVTRYAQPKLIAAARMRSSSGSRQTLDNGPMDPAATVCRCTKEVSNRACRAEKPNLSRSFSAISSRTSCEAQMIEAARICRHIRRHAPSVVKMASQTLLSSRTRTRQGENFLFRQIGFARQTVERSQEPIQFALFGEKTIVKPRGLLVGETPDFFNYLARRHTANLSLSTRETSRNSVFQRERKQI